MKVISQIVNIPKDNIGTTITTEFIENKLTKLNISPIRWAIISVSDTIITVSVAKLIKQEG